MIYNGIFSTELEEKYHSYFKCIPYELHDFQKYSIKSIVDGDHALVMAKNGCGKTVSAEFAIQYFVNQGKKVLYSLPTKASCYQQFHKFSCKYPNISFGIFTGDIQYNPMANVLFATMEIVDNIFTNDIVMDINKINCLIIDEMSFFLHEERGHVWENTILHLPCHIQMVMLSVMMENPIKFASWCETANESFKKVSISSMKERIIPLIHYSYFLTPSILKKKKRKDIQNNVCQEEDNPLIELQNRTFHESNYHKIEQTYYSYLSTNRCFVINQLSMLLKKENLLPALFFAFSRKNVEQIANGIHINLFKEKSNSKSKSKSKSIRDEAFQLLCKIPNHQEYINLPEYENLMKLLEKGIGIHHSGMIPILRELVEIFLSKNYIKILVATSSFSIGLDCPIKTTVFTSLKQYDGIKESYLLPHEYSQMSGRCGRNNIDTQGYVIHCNNLFPLPSLLEYKEILSDKLPKMKSQYRISYHNVLNMMDNTMEFMVKNMERTMMGQEKMNEITCYDKELTILIEKEKSKKQIISSLKTPILTIIEYNELHHLLNNTVKEKKRKEIERKIGSILEEYKTCIRDRDIYNECVVFQNNLLIMKTDQEERKHFLFNQIKNRCKILDYYHYSKEGKIQEKGKIARKIHEIHPLQFNDMLVNVKTLSEFIAICFCFTNIRVKKETNLDKINEKMTIPMKEKIDYILSLYDSIEKQEKDYQIIRGIHYKNTIVNDIFHEIQLWIDAKEESECQDVLRKIQVKGISIGDFSKAILKISAMSREMMSCSCTYEFYFILNQVDSVLLKSVCTNQTLYSNLNHFSLGRIDNNETI